MIKTQRKIAYIALFLFFTLSSPLQATYANTSNSHSRNYTNSYCKVLVEVVDIKQKYERLATID